MRTLSVGKLSPGMVLAEAAYNFQGVLLLGAGATLTKNSIRILKSWGVIKVSVEGESKEKTGGDQKTRQRIRAVIQQELQRKFPEIPSDPVIVEIMRVSAAILEERSLLKEGQDETR